MSKEKNSAGRRPAREALLFEAPQKPIGEMTDEELDAWAADFGDRVALALAKKMGIDPSEVEF